MASARLRPESRNMLVWWRGSAPPGRGKAPSPHEHVLNYGPDDCALSME